MNNTNPEKMTEVAVQLPAETKVEVEVAEVEVESEKRWAPVGRKGELMQLSMRATCMVASVIALAVMVTAHQSGSLLLFGAFRLPISSSWSSSYSFRYLVAISAIVAAHSLLQLLIVTFRLSRKSPVVPSQKHAWIMLAADQVLAYLTMSAGSAASGVTNLNRTGVEHTPLPNFCEPLNVFCNHVVVSVVFTFFACGLLAASALQEVLAYLTMSAGSAASVVTNLNRTGVEHTPLPNSCEPLNVFCNHVVVSVVFTFFTCGLLAAFALQEVVWLCTSSNY